MHTFLRVLAWLAVACVVLVVGGFLLLSLAWGRWNRGK